MRDNDPVEVLPRPRRWPWALAAAVTGAAGSAGLVVLLRRWLGEDAVDAQEPAELRAVVDRPRPSSRDDRPA